MEPRRIRGLRYRATGIALTLAVVVAALGACARTPEKLAAPNVLVIVIDCLRADHVGAYGYSRPTTPTLDALAAGGTVFESAFAQSHWTRPSVPSILTGLYPGEHGLLEVERSDTGAMTGASLAPEARTLAEDLKGVVNDTALIGEQHQLAPAFGLGQGFDFYRNHAHRAPHIRRTFQRWVSGREGAPFFAYLHYLDIHWPYCPPARFRGRFDDGQSELAICRDWAALRRDIRAGKRRLSEADVERLRARYDEELLALDASMNSLFEDLKGADLWDDTLIIVTSDHGEEFMEHGSIGHATGLVDVLLSVPLIMKPPAGWPGRPRARVTDLVELRSIAATVREAAGAAPGPGGPSLVPHLLGRSAPAPPLAVVAESSEAIHVRTRTHALVVSKGEGSARLFDRRAEATESTDVLAAQPETAAELRRLARLWRDALVPVAAADATIDGETVEGLRSLGYID